MIPESEINVSTLRVSIVGTRSRSSFPLTTSRCSSLHEVAVITATIMPRASGSILIDVIAVPMDDGISAYLVLIEPKLVEVDAKGYIEVIFLQQIGGCGLTVDILKPDIDYRLGPRCR